MLGALRPSCAAVPTVHCPFFLAMSFMFRFRVIGVEQARSTSRLTCQVKREVDLMSGWPARAVPITRLVGIWRSMAPASTSARALQSASIGFCVAGARTDLERGQPRLAPSGAGPGRGVWVRGGHRFRFIATPDVKTTQIECFQAQLGLSLIHI